MLRLLEREELSVGELARALQLPQSTVSRHLKLLHDGGWILKRPVRTASLYRLLPEALDETALPMWTLVSEQLQPGPLMDEDDTRLDEVLAERREDSRAFFGRLGSEWDQRRVEMFGHHFTAPSLLSLIDPAWTVADLGCGTGNAAALLAPIVDRVIAVDREPTMLEVARERLERFRNVDFRTGDLEALPLEDASVDAAVAILVLHHLHEPIIALREMARVTKPGGAVLAIDIVPHDREAYQHTMGHRHLGFSDREMKAWFDELGLRHFNYRRLAPDTHATGPGLFAASGWKR